MSNTNIAVIISITSLVVSVFNIFLIYRREIDKSIREKEYKHVGFMLEVDKMLLTDPKLWSIYDSHYINSSIEVSDDMTHAKKDALLYFILNSFEIVYCDYCMSKENEDWQAWHAFLVELIGDSKRLCEIIEKEVSVNTFCVDFEDYLKSIIGKEA